MLNRLKTTLKAGAAVLCAIVAALPVAQAQEYPTRPVHVIIGYAPGGPLDTVVRLMAPSLQKNLGQTIVVESKPGASGSLAANFVAKAAPDGYTLMVVPNATQTINPHVQQETPFNPLKDYTPISMLMEYTNVLIVNKDFAAKSVGELVEYAKKNPVKLSYGSAGIGSSGHLAAELLTKLTGAQMVHIPYKGNAPAVADLIGGNIAMLFDIVGSHSIPLISSNRVRALAVSSSQRNPMLPNVPTMVESGLKDFVATGWYALEGPPAMPAKIVARLNSAVHATLADAEFAKRMLEAGYNVSPSTPDALANRIKADYELWGSVASGLKLR